MLKLAPESEGGGGANTNPPAAAPQLTSDQQKIAAAIDKANASTPAGEKAPVQPKIHKTIFKDPPKDLLEKDLGGEMTEEGGEIEAPPVKKTETTTKKDDTTTKGAAQPEKGAKETIQGDVQPTGDKGTQQVAAKTSVDPRAARGFDYSGFSPEETTLLKQMSNPAREFTAKAIRELNTLKSSQPQAFYQHPEGYTLTKEWADTNKEMEFTAKDVQYWKQQLIKIRRGEDWTMLQGFDDSGRPVLGETFKATEEADINISNALQQMMTAQQQLVAKQQALKQSWSERVKQDDTVLQQQRAERFEWNKDPKLLEEKIPIGDKEYTVKQVRDQFKSWFASYHQTNPLMELMADMFAGLQVYGAKIRMLEGANVQEKELRADALRGEPAPETVAAGKGEGVEFSMEGLPE